MSWVAIEKCEDPLSGAEKLLRKLDFSAVAKDKVKVLIKPNLTTSDSAESGITSDVRVTEAIVEGLLNAGIRSITIGEGAGGASTMYALQKNGYVDLAKKHGLPIIDLNLDESVLVDVPDPLSMRRVKVSKTVYESDFRISVAKLKIHSIAVTTGTMKNMMGALSGRRWKLIVHSDIHNRLVDMNKAILPHFGIIDGIIGNQRDEVKVFPIKVGLLLGGFDPVAVDSIASEVMSVPWREVPYLVLAQDAGLGVADPAQIRIKGPSVEEVRRPFDRQGTIWAKTRTGFQILSGRIWQSIERA